MIGKFSFSDDSASPSQIITIDSPETGHCLRFVRTLASQGRNDVHLPRSSVLLNKYASSMEFVLALISDASDFKRPPEDESCSSTDFIIVSFDVVLYNSNRGAEASDKCGIK